jgi:hypothetical protein
MDLHHRLQEAYVTLGLEPKETVAAQGHDSIDSSSSVDKIKAAFRKMALEHHPDKIVHNYRSLSRSDDTTGNTDHFCAVHSAYKLLLAHLERQHINNSRKEGRGAVLSPSTSRRKVVVQHRMDSLQRQWDDDSTKLRRSIHAQSSLEQQRVDRISQKSKSRVMNHVKASCLTSGKGTSTKASHCRSTSVLHQTTSDVSAKADAQRESHATSSTTSASSPAADTAPGIAATTNSCCSTSAAAPLPAATMASMAPCCLPYGIVAAPLSLSADRRVAMHVLLLQESKLRLQATQCERTLWESIVTACTIHW